MCKTPMSLRSRHLSAFSLLFGVHLEDELVGPAQFGRVLLELLVLFDLVVVGGVEQQLFDVCGLQPVRGHVHQHLTQLAGGELQMGDEDGCREEKNTSIPLAGKVLPPEGSGFHTLLHNPLIKVFYIL